MRRFVILLSIFALSVSLSAASLKGSKKSMRKQNAEADLEDLTRIDNDAQLERFKRAKLLVRIPEGPTIHVDERIDPRYRYCRPWTLVFLKTEATKHYALFHEPLQVNSAIRTVESQRRLRRWNPNAAPPDGKNASSHPTGATIDIAKKDMSKAELKWMRSILSDLKEGNYLEAVEEHVQPCFHVMVFKGYAAAVTKRPPQRSHPKARRQSSAAKNQ